VSGRGGFRPCHVCGETDRLARRFRKSGYTIVRCGACGLVFVHEIPAPDELARVYGEGFFAVGRKFAGDAEGVGVVNARHRIARLIALPAVGREHWLDVGCATGDFLVAARGTARETTGVELSTFAAERARERGLRVLAGDFAGVDLPANAFDVVSMWDYIEHVPDPRASLERALTLLKPGAYLVISTGDAASLAARAMGRFWHLMIPPRHLYFFTPETLIRLLQETGFQMVQIDRPSKRVPLDFAAWKLAQVVVPPLAPRVLAGATRLGLGRVQPAINLRDIMTVAARKAV
jgi:SAM-dependent methyltransferase